MKVYLVGGAVRDQLLKIQVKDKDWVVVGSSVKQMLDAGYQQVGQDFPVFLHPKSKQEYALARTEKKQGAGYTGFVCQADETVSLEDDLMRRDLTINAIAQDENGNLIDPYNGQKDIQNKILRHVSPAFIEDPLRVLRVARFAARFAHLGFQVATETLELMREIAASGELEHLTPERIWLETEKALLTHDPQVYFKILKETHALQAFLPELDSLWGVPNPPKWHPEIDSGVHTLMVLKRAAQLSDNVSIRFSALCHDFGKAVTPKEKWPSHHGHCEAGIPIIKNVCQRLRVPNIHKELAIMVSAFHSRLHKLDNLDATSIVSLLDKMDVWRKPERLDDFLLCCQADFQGRLQFENKDYPQANRFKNYYQACLKVTAKTFVEAGLKGAEIRQAVFDKRVEMINNYQQNN